MRRVIVPIWPGLFSAFGLLLADVEEMRLLVADMEREAIETLAAEGFETGKVVL